MSTLSSFDAKNTPFSSFLSGLNYIIAAACVVVAAATAARIVLRPVTERFTFCRRCGVQHFKYSTHLHLVVLPFSHAFYVCKLH